MDEHRKRQRVRSRSPRPEKQHLRSDVKKHRSHSPPRHSHHSRRDKSHQLHLPFNAPHLHKHHLVEVKSLFGEYLDLQKQIDINDLTDDEVKGRWKSFVGKWNRGELAEGWYDPETKRKVDERSAQGTSDAIKGNTYQSAVTNTRVNEDDEDDEDDEYGPAPPRPVNSRSGPALPGLQDLQHRRELDLEEREALRSELQHERKFDRKVQKDRLEELVPRPDPGSRERQLEKKRDNAAANRDLRNAKDSGDQEVGDNDLMGGDSVDAYKTQTKTREKQKNEREIRKEEMLRARAAEREVKLTEHRVKEEKTMNMLKSLAQQRFGGEHLETRPD